MSDYYIHEPVDFGAQYVAPMIAVLNAHPGLTKERICSELLKHHGLTLTPTEVNRVLYRLEGFLFVQVRHRKSHDRYWVVHPLMKFNLKPLMDLIQ